MKVTLEKYGGLAAGIRRPPKTIDAGGLSASVAEELQKLVDAAKSAAPAGGDEPGRARDAMSYNITVEQDGQPVVLEQSDGAMSPEFRKLVRWLDSHKD